jgi:hypothetical protein
MWAALGLHQPPAPPRLVEDLTGAWRAAGRELPVPLPRGGRLLELPARFDHLYAQVMARAVCFSTQGEVKEPALCVFGRTRRQR